MLVFSFFIIDIDLSFIFVGIKRYKWILLITVFFLFCVWLKLLVESEFSAERTVEVRTRVEPFVPLVLFGLRVSPLRRMKMERCWWSIRVWEVNAERHTFLPLKLGLYHRLLVQDVLGCWKMWMPISSGSCPSVVSKVLCGNRFSVMLGQNKLRKDWPVTVKTIREVESWSLINTRRKGELVFATVFKTKHHFCVFYRDPFGRRCSSYWLYTVT